jgi:chromosome segregation protein
VLKLSRIEMIGFKSFCDKAEISFPKGTGVTAIVGPNGCGKSNIADAIAWVLGEQSVKSLRGSSMEDVIFNGTRDRQPLGLAQVSLTLVDPEFTREAEVPVSETRQEDLFEGDASNSAEPSNGDSEGAAKKARARRRVEPKPGEVVVTRKLYRSGESEYHLNGRHCRLRDIQELFMGTGLGPNSYAIIEQGRVGQILSSKPTDRRMLIEEAAGTTKYKAKRKLAEAKLEAAKLNLSRVNDIIEEVARQLHSLKRQAAKARRYKELREDLREKLTSILFSKLVGLEETIARARQELSAAATHAEAARGQLSALEAEQVATQQHSFELEDLLRQRHETLSQTNLELDRAKNRIVYSHQQLGALEQRFQEMIAESEMITGLMESLDAEIALKRGDDDRLQAELQEVEVELSAKNQQASELAEHGRQQEASLEHLRAQLLDAVQRAATLANQIAQIDEADARLSAQRERMERESREALAEGNQLRQAREELARAAAGELAELDRITYELAERNRNHEAARARELELQIAIDDLKRQQTDSQARLHSIEEIVSHHAYVDEGVKKLLAAEVSASHPEFKALGVLADFVEVDSEFEQAIEEFLKDELEFLVVENSEAAKQGIEILRRQTGGRSTFVVQRTGLSAEAPKSHADPGILAQSGVVASVSTKVRLQGRLAEAADQILPVLSNAYLVDSFETADRLARRFPRTAFVTREGEVFRGCWIRGGRKSGTGPLALKRELRALAGKITEFDKLLAKHEAERSDVRTQIVEVEGVIQSLNDRRIELEKSRVSSDHRLQQFEADASRASQKVAVIQDELARLELERHLASEAQKAAQHELKDLELAKESIEAQIQSESSAIRDLKLRQEVLNAEISDGKSQLAALVERKQSSQQVLDRLLLQQRETLQRKERLRQQQAAAQDQQNALRSALVEAEAEVARLTESQTLLECSIEESTRETESLRAKLIHLEDELRAQRETLSQSMDVRSAIEVNVAKLESELNHVHQVCEQELDRPWEELRLLGTTRLEGETLEAAESEYTQLRQKIEAMGAINMMALEEYAECEARHTFLNTQRKDLLDSIADTAQTIQEIDLVSRQQFEEAFAAINEHFQETFKQLFGGGYGAMILTDETDLLQSGIDLQAQPPGKKLQNVLLLSGGEKALTAIALLLAIFRYQPSPFCVLDEVDAPLDEANVERFSRMIEQLSGDTHFIVITHNKKTMEIARMMYGVTMQEAGVSKLVSVKFD